MRDWNWLFNNLYVPGAPTRMQLPGPLVELVAEACAHYEHGEVWDVDTESWVESPAPADNPPPPEDTPPPPVDYSRWAITTSDTGQLTVAHKPTGAVHIAQSRDAAQAVAEAAEVLGRELWR